MRRVAHRLDAGTMSLYHHVPSKDDLLESIVDHVFEQVEQPPDDVQDWADRVVFVSLSFRKEALAHPAVLPLMAGGSISGPSVLQSTEAYLKAIVQRGFSLEMAAQIYRAAASYVMGYLALEVGGYFGSVVESYQRGRFGQDGTAEYPLLSEVAPRLGLWDPEREFEAGLRHLLMGFNESLASEPCYTAPSEIEHDDASVDQTDQCSCQ